MGYIGLRLLVILFDIFGNKYEIYLKKCNIWGRTMGYIWLRLYMKLWEILGKKYGYIGKNMGNIWQKFGIY